MHLNLPLTKLPATNSLKSIVGISSFLTRVKLKLRDWRAKVCRLSAGKSPLETSNAWNSSIVMIVRKRKKSS